MTRVLEKIFGQLIRLITLVVLLPLMSLSIVYGLPRSYQSTASLWALRRYETITAPSIESTLTTTPAQTQATALSELLQTRAFALTSAKATTLASTFDPSVQANSQLLDDMLFAEISHVQVKARDYNLFVITYSNRSAQIAQQVVQAVIQNYALQNVKFSASVGAQGTSVNNLFEVIDTPVVASKPASISGLLLIAGGIGLALALLAYTLYIIILVRRDDAVYTPLDFEKVAALTVVTQLPHLAPATVSVLINGSEQH